MPRVQPTAWSNSIVRYGDADPTTLTPHPGNWRQHPAPQLAALTGSITELGWIAPVIVNLTTQHVVDGHARIAEAVARHEPSIPVAYVNLTEAQERLALASFDPITAMATTDQAILDDLLSGLTTDDGGLADLLESLATPAARVLNEDDADLTPPADPITKPGDLWLLGEHRLLCGDSTRREDVARLMNGRKANMVLTDPPYGMNLDTDYAARPERVVRGNSYAAMIGDDAPFDPRPLLAQFSAVAEQFWWGGDWYYDKLPPGGSWLVWDKRNEDADAMIGNGFESCWSKQPHRREMKRLLWAGYTARERYEPRTHPAQKPVELMSWIMERWGHASDLVVDVFAGVGTVLVAAQQFDRTAYLMEIDPGYCDVSVRRWEHLTGKVATRG